MTYNSIISYLSLIYHQQQVCQSFAEPKIIMKYFPLTAELTANTMNLILLK